MKNQSMRVQYASNSNQKSHKKKRPRKGPRKNGSNLSRDRSIAEYPTVMVVKSLNFMPDRLRTVLSFNGNGNLNNGGFTYANSRLIPTYAYDVDPVLASTSLPGFAEMQTIYRSYRVNWFRQVCAFSNEEAFPILVYMCPLNVDPGADTTLFQQLLSNKRCVKTLLGPLTGNGISTLDTGRVGVDEFGGTAMTLADDKTAAQTTSAPQNNLYIATGVITNGVNTLANGCFVTTDLYIEIDFFELLTPSV